MTGRKTARAVGVALAAGVLAAGGCGTNVEHDYPVRDRLNPGQYVFESELRERDNTTVFGGDGINLFGSGRSRERTAEGPGIAVNSFLWRASLDTVSFMPLSSADPFGGVIITEWYVPPEAPLERYKMSVYILGRDLRADGVKVAVFREQSNGNGDWQPTPISSETATSLENQILARARQLRLAQAN